MATFAADFDPDSGVMILTYDPIFKVDSEKITELLVASLKHARYAAEASQPTSYQAERRLSSLQWVMKYGIVAGIQQIDDNAGVIKFNPLVYTIKAAFEKWFLDQPPTSAAQRDTTECLPFIERLMKLPIPDKSPADGPKKKPGHDAASSQEDTLQAGSSPESDDSSDSASIPEEEIEWMERDIERMLYSKLPLHTHECVYVKDDTEDSKLQYAAYIVKHGLEASDFPMHTAPKVDDLINLIESLVGAIEGEDE